MDQSSLEEIGIERPLKEEVARLASLAVGAGSDGIVCSPQEAAEMRALLGPGASSPQEAAEMRALLGPGASS